MTEAWKSDRIASALRGENPTVLRRLDAGFAVIADVQFLPGYCVLLTDTPGIDRLSDLRRRRRLAFLADMDLLGEAIETVCSRRDPAFRRMNYSVLGNVDALLHAHVVPRYTWEPEQYTQGPIALYPPEIRTAPETLLGPQHDGLRAELAEQIDRLRSDHS